MSNVFSESEVSILLAALAIYKDNAAPLMSIEKHNAMIVSSVSKIKSISPLTFFTNDEYIIMYYAVDYYISNVAKPPRGTLKLLQRLKKYDPCP